MMIPKNIGRQLLFIDYKRNETAQSDNEQKWEDWPTMESMSASESRYLFEIMEDLGIITGFHSQYGIKFQLTNKGASMIAEIKRNGVRHEPLYGGLPQLSEEDISLLNQLGGESVFVVHSDNPDAPESLSKEVQSFVIGTTGREAKLLQPTVGQNLWEEFEKQAEDCGAAICIWASDRENPDSPYVRPNVILETGYFMSKLGKGKVIIIKANENLQVPSDLSGIVWATKSNWREKLPGALYMAMQNKKQILRTERK